MANIDDLFDTNEGENFDLDVSSYAIPSSDEAGSENYTEWINDEYPANEVPNPDANRPATKEQAASFLEQLKRNIGDTSSSQTSVSPSSQTQDACPIYQSQSPKSRKPRTPKPRVRYRTPEQYKAFLSDADDYIRTPFGHYADEKKIIILKHFKRRHIPSCPIQLGSMFQHLYDSAEKYVREAR